MPSEISESNTSGYIGFYVFKLLGLIPLPIRSSLGAAIGYLIALFPSKALKVATLQIEKMLNAQDASKIARQSFIQAGRTSFECVDLRNMISNPGNFISLHNPAEVDRIISQKRGIVALTAHFSNFDAMGAYFASRKVNLLVVAKQLRNASLQKTLELLRESFGFKTLWRAKKSGIRRILDSLKTGWIVASLIDHDTRVSSTQIPFFDLPASTPIALVELGKKTDSLIVSAFVVRKSGCNFEIHVEEIPAHLSVEEILSIYNQRLEKFIRQYPEQWSWTHKRWRTVEDQRLGSREYIKYLESLPSKNLPC